MKNLKPLLWSTTLLTSRTFKLVTRCTFAFLLFALFSNNAKAQISGPDTVHVNEEVTFHLYDSSQISYERDYHIDWFSDHFTTIDSSTGWGDDYITVKYSVAGDNYLTADLIVDSNFDYPGPYYVIYEKPVVVIP